MEKKNSKHTTFRRKGSWVERFVMPSQHSVFIPTRGILLLIQSHFLMFSTAPSHPTAIDTRVNRLKGFSMQKSNELGKEIKLNSCLIAFNPVRFGKAVIMSCNFSFLRHLLGWWGGLMDFSTVKHSSLSIKV